MSLAKMSFFGTTCSGTSVVAIGPIHVVHGKVPGPVGLTIYPIGVRLTAHFLKSTSLAKMSFFGTTCSGASAIAIGPIQAVHGKVPGPVGLTIYPIGVRLTADFLKSMSYAK